MLERLYISNIVLIDNLELDFRSGLTVLTGETGAGKSILLDALSLALGAKADPGLIRAGQSEATVVADFGENILKRTMTLDGKSKCWINGEPTTQKALKELGDELVEVHGQFANHGLLDEKTHVKSLDDFGGYDDLLAAVRAAYEEMHAAEKQLKDLRVLLEKSAADRDFLEHSVGELAALNPEPGEEERLAEMRSQMMSVEKNAAVLKEAAAALEHLPEKIFGAAHVLERTKSYQPQIDKLYEAGSALEETLEQIAPADFDASDLEAAEERLFALRAAARKHRVTVAELPAVLEKMRAELSQIDNSDEELKRLENTFAAKKSDYEKFASALTQERIAASSAIRADILAELPDLKLGGADFKVETLAGAASACGSDSVRFLIKTNPGMPFAALDRAASGGELARFMLALRVAIGTPPAATDGAVPARALIFDEIDTGISGATASAVGARLARLALGRQIIVITHSAQVAGFGDSHFLITKATDGKTTKTAVRELSGDARVNEIARIISGATITRDSLAAAKELIKQ